VSDLEKLYIQVQINSSSVPDQQSSLKGWFLFLDIVPTRCYSYQHTNIHTPAVYHLSSITHSDWCTNVEYIKYHILQPIKLRDDIAYLVSTPSKHFHDWSIGAVKETDQIVAERTEGLFASLGSFCFCSSVDATLFEIYDLCAASHSMCYDCSGGTYGLFVS